MGPIIYPRRRSLMLLIILALTTPCLPGCSQAPVEAAAVGDAAATLEKVPGTDLNRVTLTERAVGNIGLETATTATDPKTKKLTVPYEAILYDSQGKTWVYTNPEPRVYVRRSIIVERIDGAVALLAAGPAPGTTVVTLGAEELFGAELDTAH
jgi:hypothetical protein